MYIPFMCFNPRLARWIFDGKDYTESGWRNVFVMYFNLSPTLICILAILHLLKIMW